VFYVYILKNTKTNKFYIGYTSDLKRRYTKHKRNDQNFELVYYEAYKASKDARLREKRLKYFGKALAQLKRRIFHSLVITS